MPGIAGRDAAILANIYLFGLGRRTQVRASFRDLSTCSTGIDRRFLGFCGFGFLLFRGPGHNKSPYQFTKITFMAYSIQEQSSLSNI
jgi:hypothetical protein